MSAEDRLRTALSAVADETEIDPMSSLDRIERRTATARRRRRAVGGGLAAAVLVAVVAVPLALLGDDGDPVRTGPASDTRDGTTTSTTSTTVAPDPGTATEPLFVWPADGRRYASAEAVVEAFATEYLGVVRPVVEGGGDDSSFVVRPRGEDGAPAPAQGPRTVVRVADVEGHPAVVGATSPNLEVDAPADGATVTSPVGVAGRGRGLYEGTVLVQVRDQAGAVLATVPTTAAGSGFEVAPFSVDVSFPGGSGRGALVVASTGGLEGTPEATVVPVTFGAPPSGQPTTEVTVYLVDDRGDFVPVTREVPRTTGVLRAAVLELLEGATPEEEARGLSSPFDGHTDLLRGVTISEDRTAIVDLVPDFGARIPNSSASAMSYAILGSLDRTVFQFPSVTWVAYRFGGECGTFGELDPDLLCDRRTRDQY